MEASPLMGYNITLGPLTRWAPELDKIRLGESRIASSDPKTLAYRLHEALRSARANDVEPYASMSLSFKTTPGYLIINPHQDLVLDSNSTEPMEFPAAETAFDIVQSASGITQGELYFPGWNGENSKMVETWAKAKGWEMNLTDDGILVLTKAVP